MSNCPLTNLPNVSIGETSFEDALTFHLEHEGKSLRYAFARDVYVQYFGSNKITSLSETEKLTLLNKIISINRIGKIPLFVWDENTTQENDAYQIIEFSPLMKSEVNHQRKEEDILSLLSTKLKHKPPFSPIDFHLFDLYELNILNGHELKEWLISLGKKGFITFNPNFKTPSSGIYEPSHENYTRELTSQKNLLQITIKGWGEVYRLRIPSASRNVFIALAYRIEMAEIERAILRACENLHWSPQIVKNAEHNDGIMDKVIALINESHFVIADLTYQRGGVYYEAGYAKGRGLPVIYCVRKEDIKKCHFDVKHLNIITYTSPEDLLVKLDSRIRATIGSYERQV